MLIPKNKPYRNPQLLRDAKDAPCMRCGSMDWTVVACHIQGPRAHAFNKGLSQKPSDAAVAYLCHQCHTHMDSYAGGSGLEYSEEFLFLIVRTHEWRLQQK